MTSDFRRFFRAWLNDPATAGAVSPSGRALARAMASQAPADGDWPVLELGPGTGPVTAALITRGIAPERIVAVEFYPDFCALLVDRFRGINVVEGNAYNLAASLPPGLTGPYAAAISSLPLLNRPPPERKKLVADVLDRLLPGAPFVQFSYGPFPPVKPIDGHFTVRRTAFVLANLPPAQVWVYRLERRSGRPRIEA
jgi:phosphatidylethanolamine/phosphatidyl-N-methylethanolamine N-methyltransferase